MGQDRRNKIKKQIKKQEDEFSGEGTASGSAPDQVEDSDVDAIYKGVIGHEPEDPAVNKDGTTLAEEVDAAEDERRGKSGHEEEDSE